MTRSLFFFLGLFLAAAALAQSPAPAVAEAPQLADRATYLAPIAALCHIDWPKNRTVTVVCHGHSVPAGYFVTPEVRTMEAYPHRLHVLLGQKYPHAVISVVVTAIGGEASERGSARFERDVLSLRPDVVTIDYAINDMRLGLERARRAWVAMIEAAQAKGVKVILLTPTPTLTTKFADPADPLNQHAEQIRALARQYHTGLVDSLGIFARFEKEGGQIPSVMAQSNHPNEKGHAMVAQALSEWFP